MKSRSCHWHCSYKGVLKKIRCFNINEGLFWLSQTISKVLFYPFPQLSLVGASHMVYILPSRFTTIEQSIAFIFPRTNLVTTYIYHQCSQWTLFSNDTSSPSEIVRWRVRSSIQDLPDAYETTNFFMFFLKDIIYATNNNNCSHNFACKFMLGLEMHVVVIIFHF